MLQIFLKHKKIFGLLLAIIFVIFFILVVKNSQKAPTSEVLSNIIPGSSTKNDVVSKLGNPISEKTQGAFTISEFKSDSPTRNNEITFQNNKVEFFKRVIVYGQPLKIKDVIKIYGNTNVILYGTDSVAGFYLFVYPDKGIAYLGNNNTGDLLEIWYFAPTTLESFQNNWAPGFSSKLEDKIQQ